MILPGCVIIVQSCYMLTTVILGVTNDSYGLLAVYVLVCFLWPVQVRSVSRVNILPVTASRQGFYSVTEVVVNVAGQCIMLRAYYISCNFLQGLAGQ